MYDIQEGLAFIVSHGLINPLDKSVQREKRNRTNFNERLILMRDCV